MNGRFRRDVTAHDGGFLGRVTAPATRIISTADAKRHCRIEHDDDDAEISSFVAAVEGHLDAQNGILGRALITQTWRLNLNGAPSGNILRLAFPPVQSVTEIKYIDASGVEQTFAASNYRVILAGDDPFIELVNGASWPTVQNRSGALWVNFVAGYGDSASDVPADLITAAKMLLGHLYENREAVQDGRASSVPFSFEAMASPFRVDRF
jgi:uncharacterized phiE125 gp8 family phage protein